MKVCKFGGSSLASADQIRKVCDIILSDETRKIIVVSAPGKRNPEDKKVTDLLINLAEAVSKNQDCNSAIKAICDRFTAIAREMNLGFDIVDEIKSDLKQKIQNNGNKDDLLAALKSAGEDNCAKLLSAYLNSLGHKASYVNPREAGLFLSVENSQVKVLEESYENLAYLKEKAQNELIIFPGFFAYTKTEKIITFSRGGSDISGSILAAAINAEVYENWTDVDSVFVVNPNLIKKPQEIEEITYSEMRELAYAGFSVIHEEALAPAFNKQIKVNIRNTNNPYSKGTWIVPERENFEGIITGIAGSKGFSTIYISKYLMNKEIGFALKALQILADYKIPFEHMPSGMDSLSIIIRDENLKHVDTALLLKDLKNKLQADQIRLENGYAMIMIVGDAMAQTVGVTARASAALSRAGINLELINQGISEISTLFGIRQEFCNLAIKELYREFFLR